jgi:hypothetical protein
MGFGEGFLATRAAETKQSVACLPKRWHLTSQASQAIVLAVFCSFSI